MCCATRTKEGIRYVEPLLFVQYATGERHVVHAWGVEDEETVVAVAVAVEVAVAVAFEIAAAIVILGTSICKWYLTCRVNSYLLHRSSRYTVYNSYYLLPPVIYMPSMRVLNFQSNLVPRTCYLYQVSTYLVVRTVDEKGKAKADPDLGPESGPASTP